jgi:serine phosphatase RsbU (regulator of sigma subunit)
MSKGNLQKSAGFEKQRSSRQKHGEEVDAGVWKKAMTFPLAGAGTPMGRSDHAPYPADLTKLDGLDLMALYRAGRRGGNFFDRLAIGQRVVFLLTDIAGARDEARALAVDMQTTFRQYAADLFGSPEANESEAIATLAYELNRSLMEAARGVHFAPAFLGCFSLPLGILTYHNAGLLAVFHDPGGARTLGPGGTPLGLFTHNTYEPAVLAFEPRARLLLVTRAVTESRRGAFEFGTKRVQGLLANVEADSALQICESVLQQAYALRHRPWSRFYDRLHYGKHRGNDDLTAVALVRDFFTTTAAGA